jgi:2TM domain-containing protein
VPKVVKFNFGEPGALQHVLVNIGLFVINLLTGGGWWFYWPLLGWGVGLGIHALSVFAFGGRGPWDRDWEERKIRELMDRDPDRWLKRFRRAAGVTGSARRIGPGPSELLRTLLPPRE